MGRIHHIDATGAGLTMQEAEPPNMPDVDDSVPIPSDRWAVYLIECMDGRVYTGIARDPEQRYAKHVSGKGARFTRSNPPRRLLGWVWVAGHGTALRLEITWKRLPREERIAALAANLHL